MSQPKKTLNRKKNQWGYSTNFEAAGIRYRRWFPTLDEAKDFQRTKESEARAQRDGVTIKRKPITLAQLYAAYTAFAAKHPATKHQLILQNGATLVQLLGDNIKLSEIKRVHLEQFIVSLMERKYTDGTIKNYYNQARQFLNYAVTAFPDNLPEDWQAPIANKARLPRKLVINSRTRVLTFDELRAFHQALHHERYKLETYKGSRFRLAHVCDFFALQFLTCKRGKEIRTLKWSNVNFEANYIEFNLTKTRRKQRMHITAPVREILLRRKLSESETVFPPNIKEAIAWTYRLAAKHAGLVYGNQEQGGFVSHDLRHTVATYAIRQGAHSPLVAHLLGHKIAEGATAVYTNLSDNDLIPALEKIAQVWAQVTATECRDNDGTNAQNPSFLRTPATIKKAS